MCSFRLACHIRVEWKAKVVFQRFPPSVIANAFYQMVLSVAIVVLPALHQRIAEIRHVTAGFPSPRVHQDSRIQPHHIVALRYDRPPPRLLDIALQLHPQRPVVPSGAEAAVDFAALEHEPAAFGQGKNFVHIGVGQRAGHRETP